MRKKKLLYVPDFEWYAGPFRTLFDVTLNPKDYPRCDVVMLTGGADINPALYGDTLGSKTHIMPLRDMREKALFDRAREDGKPFLGICRGAQFLCAMAGGKLAQHITGHENGEHRITTNEGEEYQMSTLHHQMMVPKGTTHELLAWTESLSRIYWDGTNTNIPNIEVEPEIVYFNEIKALGIQGHPEMLRQHHSTLPYLNRLVEERLM